MSLNEQAMYIMNERYKNTTSQLKMVENIEILYEETVFEKTQICVIAT